MGEPVGTRPAVSHRPPGCPRPHGCRTRRSPPHRPAAARWGDAHFAEAIRERVGRTRRDGYAVSPGLVVEGSWGMAAAVFDRSGRPAWARTLTGVETRFRADRQPELGALLLHEAHVLSRAMRTPEYGTRR
nr:IclR family transcriptional regulator C-terminal domain-containing protein [Actinopolyspora erythraea]